MIFYNCNDCKKAWTTEFDEVRCPSCDSENISYKNFVSKKEFVCNKCMLIIETDFSESKGAWNWKCPECGAIAQSRKNISIRTSIKTEKIGEFRKFKPNVGEMMRQYGDDAINRSVEDFKKKKRY